MEYLKADRVGPNKFRVLAIPFGGPMSGKDTDEQFFSRNTDIKPDWFSQRPLLFHHGQDHVVKDESIGFTDDLELEDDGWWVNAWVNRASQYWAQIDTLMDRAKMFGSSGTLNYLARIDHKTGEILKWPFVEETFTPTPANFFSTLVPAKAIDHFDAAGIELSPVARGLISDLESPSADLPTDLAPAGDEAAIQRLAGQVARLEELIKNL
jgi:hypothetical protein